MEIHSVAYSGISAFKTQQTPCEYPRARSSVPPNDLSKAKDVFEKSYTPVELEANMPDTSVRDQRNLVVRFFSHLLTYYGAMFLSQFVSVVLCLNGIASSLRKADKEYGGFIVLCILSFMVYLPAVDMAIAYRNKNADHYMSSRLSFLISLSSILYLLLDPSSIYRSPECARLTNLGSAIDDPCSTASIVLVLQCISMLASSIALFLTWEYPESDPISPKSSIYTDRRAQVVITAMIFYTFLNCGYRFA